MKARLLSSLALLPLAGTLLHAQQPADTPAPPPAPAAEAAAEAPLQADPLLYSGQLANGLRYLIRPTVEPIGQASMRLYVSLGSLNESEDTKGISHFIEHMVFNGSRNFPNGEMIPAMQRHGLGFGGDANAYTGMQQTVYTVDLPNVEQKTVDFALTILRDFADGAELADAAIEHERGIIMSELKVRDSAASRADLELMSHVVPGTRVPYYPPIGSAEVIRNCPPERIRQYYRENYVPSRMTLIITGGIDPGVAAQWVEQHFGSMEARPEPPRPSLGTLSDTGAGAFVVPHGEAANSTITMAVVSPWTARPDTLETRAASLPLRLACHMLDQRLARLARRADCPFLSATMVPRENVYTAAELFALRVTTPTEQWSAGLAAAEAELRRAIEYGFSKAELMEAVGSIDALNRKSIQAWVDVPAQKVAQKLIGTLDNNTLFTPPAEDARAYAAGIRRVMATPALCSEALAAAYEADRARLILSGKIAEGATAEALAAAYAEARRQPVAPPEAEKLTPFAYGYIGEAGSVASEKFYGDIGVHTFVLGNGVKLNLKPIGAGQGRIFVSAAVEGGMMRLPRVAGLPEMAASVIAQGGLEAHTADEVARLFAGKNVSTSFKMDEERFIFSGNTTTQDLDFECKLLCAAILHPGFRTDGEARLRRSLPTLFQRMATTPNGAFSKQSCHAIFGDDPRCVPPTPEQFAAIGTADVKAAMEPWLQKGAMEVTLVGDFKVDEVLPTLLGSFGALPPREPEFGPLPEGARRIDFRPWGQSAMLPYDTELDKTIVAQVFPAGDGRDKRRNRRLEVLRLIAAERLFETVRAELGESYSPSMMLELRPDYEGAATFTASSVGEIGNLQAVSTAMDHVFASLGRGEISEAEFQRAIAPYIRDADMAYSLPIFWANSLARFQSEPQSLGLLCDFHVDARAIRLEEIRRLAIDIFGSGKVNRYYTVPRFSLQGTPQE